ncbi:MAG: 3-phosphoshikimate 1-carboxyvinyltransferase [Verrucomicrobiota bacterium]
MNTTLPELIEIVPLSAPVEARVTVPGSKSITNRALILAALAIGKTRLEGALWSEDTQVMVDCLRQLGFGIEVLPDPAEESNRIIVVEGFGGKIPLSGTPEKPLELFVGNAGTAARFLAAFVCLGQGTFRLSGVPRMHQRPQAALFDALRQLGCRVDSANNKLPAIIHASGPRPAECIVSIEESSQFASALLLVADKARWRVNIIGENADESPYVSMTTALISQFPAAGGAFTIEPDASSASYFWGADWLLRQNHSAPQSRISVASWMQNSLQIDARFPGCINEFPPQISRLDELGDSIMTAIVLAPFANEVKTFTHLGRLRLQECERVEALRTELGKCGAQVEERGDTLRIHPGNLRSAEIETYNDHRMAMCFATLALKVPGIKIKNPACVRKTFPNFFEKLAMPAPHGLGATIIDSASRQRLSPEHLRAH